MIDVKRLAAALGIEPRRIDQPKLRRSVLRGMAHPAGPFGFPDLQKARGEAKNANRSLVDLECELMAYNGFSPDDERIVRKHMQSLGLRVDPIIGETPFFDRWSAAGDD